MTHSDALQLTSSREYSVMLADRDLLGIVQIAPLSARIVHKDEIVPSVEGQMTSQMTAEHLAQKSTVNL